MTTFIYQRVSSNTQDEKSQFIGIKKYLDDNNITHTINHTDKASGSIPWAKREIAKVLEICKEGDLLLVSEISRIGRSTADVLNFLECAISKGLIVHAVKNNITLDDSIQSTIFATVLGLAAEIEREFIKSRTKEGMARAKAEGRRLGRPAGLAKSLKLDKKAEHIKSLIAAGVAKSAVARLLEVSRGTIDRYLKRNGGI